MHCIEILCNYDQYLKIHVVGYHFWFKRNFFSTTCNTCSKCNCATRDTSGFGVRRFTADSYDIEIGIQSRLFRILYRMFAVS